MSAPGRQIDVRGYVVSNARRLEPGDRPAFECADVGDDASGAWGVRFGERLYPDYAAPDPTRWDGMHGGTYLTPDEADALADALRSAAQWARAQQLVDRHEDAA